MLLDLSWLCFSHLWWLPAVHFFYLFQDFSPLLWPKAQGLCLKHKIGKYSLIKLKNLHFPHSRPLRLGSESYSYFQAIFVLRVGWVSFLFFCGPYWTYGHLISVENTVSWHVPVLLSTPAYLGSPQAGCWVCLSHCYWTKLPQMLQWLPFGTWQENPIHVTFKVVRYHYPQVLKISKKGGSVFDL